MSTIKNQPNWSAEMEVARFAAIMLTGRTQAELDKIARDVVKTINWSNPVLMHKGLSWITRNYLKKNKML